LSARPLKRVDGGVETRRVIPVALALGSSVAWGLADFLGGLKSRSLALPTVLLLSQTVGFVIAVGVVGLVSEPLPATQAVGWAALSGVLDLAGLWALYRGLARGSMSVVAPLAATAAVVPAVFGFMIGERPSPTALAGSGSRCWEWRSRPLEVGRRPEAQPRGGPRPAGGALLRTRLRHATRPARRASSGRSWPIASVRG
jgi:uncharacterized membrane protein